MQNLMPSHTSANLHLVNYVHDIIKYYMYQISTLCLHISSKTACQAIQVLKPHKCDEHMTRYYAIARLDIARFLTTFYNDLDHFIV